MRIRNEADKIDALAEELGKKTYEERKRIISDNTAIVQEFIKETIASSFMESNMHWSLPRARTKNGQEKETLIVAYEILRYTTRYSVLCENGGKKSVRQITGDNNAMPLPLTKSSLKRTIEFVLEGKKITEALKESYPTTTHYNGWQTYSKPEHWQKLAAASADTNWCLKDGFHAKRYLEEGYTFHILKKQGRTEAGIEEYNKRTQEIYGRNQDTGIENPEILKEAERFISENLKLKKGGWERRKRFRRCAIEFIKTGILDESLFTGYDQNGHPLSCIKTGLDHIKEYYEPLMNHQLESTEKEGVLLTHYVSLGAGTIVMPHTEIKGGIHCRHGKILEMPNLERCRIIYAPEAHTLIAPKLGSCRKIYGCNLKIWDTKINDFIQKEVERSIKEKTEDEE